MGRQNSHEAIENERYFENNIFCGHDQPNGHLQRTPSRNLLTTLKDNFFNLFLSIYSEFIIIPHNKRVKKLSTKVVY